MEHSIPNPHPTKEPPHTIVITYIDQSCPKKLYNDVYSLRLTGDIWFIRSMDGRFAYEQNYLILRIETIHDVDLIDKKELARKHGFLDE